MEYNTLSEGTLQFSNVTWCDEPRCRWAGARQLENDTHPVTHREMIPVPLDLKVLASQVGRKTTFVVNV